MALSLSEATLPTYRRILTALGEMIAKAEAHASAHHYDPSVLLTERLFPDMWPFAKQVQQATSLMVRGTARLAGIAILGTDEGDLHQRLLVARGERLEHGGNARAFFLLRGRSFLEENANEVRGVLPPILGPKHAGKQLDDSAVVRAMVHQGAQAVLGPRQFVGR